MTLGERLTALRKGAGLSQEQMAAELNVSRQAISKWETDQSAPELEKLMALAELFSVSTDELLGRKVPQKETQPETAKKPDGADALTRAAFSRRCGRADPRGIFPPVLDAGRGDHGGRGSAAVYRAADAARAARPSGRAGGQNRNRVLYRRDALCQSHADAAGFRGHGRAGAVGTGACALCCGTRKR